MTQEQFDELMKDNEVIQPSKDFKLKEGKYISGYVDGLEAVKQAINFILNIERFRFHTVSSNVGVELEELYGEETSIIELRIKDTIEEALLMDDRIEKVEFKNIERIGRSKYKLDTTVSTIEGIVELSEEVFNVGG